MTSKPGILAIVIPLMKGKSFPLIKNPFIKKGLMLSPDKMDVLSNQIESTFPTLDFQKKLAMDVSDNREGSNIIYFEHLPPLKYCLGDKIKVAVITSSNKPFIRSFNLNGRELCYNPITALPMRFNEFLFGHNERPHIVNLTAEGKVCSVTMGVHVSARDFCRILRPGIVFTE